MRLDSTNHVARKQHVLVSQLFTGFSEFGLSVGSSGRVGRPIIWMNACSGNNIGEAVVVPAFVRGPTFSLSCNFDVL